MLCSTLLWMCTLYIPAHCIFIIPPVYDPNDYPINYESLWIALYINHCLIDSSSTKFECVFFTNKIFNPYLIQSSPSSIWSWPPSISTLISKFILCITSLYKVAQPMITVQMGSTEKKNLIKLQLEQLKCSRTGLEMLLKF